MLGESDERRDSSSRGIAGRNVMMRGGLQREPSSWEFPWIGTCSREREHPRAKLISLLAPQAHCPSLPDKVGTYWGKALLCKLEPRCLNFRENYRTCWTHCRSPTPAHPKVRSDSLTPLCQPIPSWPVVPCSPLIPTSWCRHQHTGANSTLTPSGILLPVSPPHQGYMCMCSMDSHHWNCLGVVGTSSPFLLDISETKAIVPFSSL